MAPKYWICRAPNIRLLWQVIEFNLNVAESAWKPRRALNKAQCSAKITPSQQGTIYWLKVESLSPSQSRSLMSMRLPVASGSASAWWGLTEIPRSEGWQRKLKRNSWKGTGYRNQYMCFEIFVRKYWRLLREPTQPESCVFPRNMQRTHCNGHVLQLSKKTKGGGAGGRRE